MAKEKNLYRDLVGNFPESQYWERVFRNAFFYADDDTARYEYQEKLKHSIVSVAGLTGAGSGVAIRLAQQGVGTIRVADDRVITALSLGRQIGAGHEELGMSAAEALVDEIHRYAPEVVVEPFPVGVNENNAANFVSGANLVIDQLRHGDWGGRIALHNAFREAKQAKCILSCSTVGWHALLFKYHPDGLSLQEWLKPDSNDGMSAAMLSHMLDMLGPAGQDLPKVDEAMSWMEQHSVVPMLAATVPVAEGLLTTRAILILLGLEGHENYQSLPPIPVVYYFNSISLSGHFSDEL